MKQDIPLPFPPPYLQILATNLIFLIPFCLGVIDQVGVVFQLHDEKSAGSAGTDAFKGVGSQIIF